MTKEQKRKLLDFDNRRRVAGGDDSTSRGTRAAVIALNGNRAAAKTAYIAGLEAAFEVEKKRRAA